MLSAVKIKQLIFDNKVSFETKVKSVYEFQYMQLEIYNKFSTQLYPSFLPATDVTKYPYLPIEFFRNNIVLANQQNEEKIFESSGTTNTNNSKHYVADLALYETSILKGFEQFYGHPSQFVFFGLLPSYLERSNASLIHMVKYLMEVSNQKEAGFYKFNYDDLVHDIKQYKGQAKKVIIGVTFALWELAEQFPDLDLSEVIIIETGGMKGRKREILREELHDILNSAFNTKNIHSEYGMTELLSQAYSLGNGIYKCPPWMKVFVRDAYDPKVVKTKGKGVLNIIDLANLYSCSFLATNDIGEVYEDGSFRVLGRMDNSKLRGCNLMFGE